MQSGLIRSNSELFTTDEQVMLWPILRIARDGRDTEPSTQALARAQAYQRLIIFRSEDGVSLSDMSAPLSPQDIISWLHSAWTRLCADSHVDVAQRKRSLMNEIMDAGLDKKEQRLLVSALDYLARLASVQKASAISGDRIQPVEVPGVKSEAMKAVYKKMAALSVTDLPIWISGERGVELDWIARTIHRIRGLPDDRHIVYEHGKTIVTVDAFLKKAQASYEDGALEATILFREIDQSPYELQKELHDIIMGRLDIMDSVRIMLTTEPIDLNSEVSNAIYPDLFAFLAPSSIEAPPLRKRTEDIRSLMEFFSHPKRKQGIFERLGNDAKEALFSYHWPRNTEELISVTRYIAARRPTGTIRVNHLPDNFHSQVGEELALKSVLEQIQIQEGFRALKDDAGRKALAQFLMSLDEKETFTPADLQRVFSMGRETSRRLLISLETRGVLEGIKGAKGQRISRYRILNSAKTIE